MHSLQIGPLTVTLHRTLRVQEGRAPASLPPSLGTMELYPVKDYRSACPDTWEDDAVFVCLHPKEALWLSFDRVPRDPLAVIVGAGGVNALTGEILTTTLQKDAYLVTPPQPWLDGWKDKDSGNVFQFVATEYKKGEGNTVAEQLIGKESKSGGIGIAVFEASDRTKLKGMPMVKHSAVGGKAHWVEDSADGTTPDCNFGTLHELGEQKTSGGLLRSSRSMAPGGQSCRSSFQEHGVGKGGAITQKVYPDPHGIEVWKQEPIAVKAVYIVSSEGFEQITGKKAPPEVKTQETHGDKVPWFKTHDEQEKDVAGSEKFTGLKSVFNKE